MTKLNNIRWYLRWPIKWAIFGIVYAFVCFPYPRLLVRHLARWSDPNSLIEPNAPELEPLFEELSARLEAGPPCRHTLAIVEHFVYEVLPYDWDWNTWGMADFIPTVSEAIAMGREDCDGRAVVAASLLERIGVRARLVTDFTHVWVATDLGQTMGARPHKAIEVTDKGMKFDARGLQEIPRAMAFGVSVFPLSRELILVATLWLLLLNRSANRLSVVMSLVLLAGGLFAVRYGGSNPWKPISWVAWVGFGAWILAVILPYLFVQRVTLAVPNEDPENGATKSDNSL